MNFADIFSPSATYAAVGWLVDGAIRSALVLLLAAGACVVLRRASAAVRHLVWTLALAASLAIVFLSSVLPGWSILPAWADSISVRQPAPIASPPPAGVTAPIPEFRIANGPSLDNDAARVTPASPAKPVLSEPRAFATWNNARICIVALWAVGALSLLARLLWTSVRVTRRGDALPVLSDGPLAEAVALVAARMHVATPEIHQGPTGAMPTVWGLWRQRLLLPSDAACWEPARLSAVLTHELAHLRRRDLWSLLVAHIARAWHWFNPLAWYAVRQMRIEQEHACDDYVLRHGTLASDYATHMVDLAAQLAPPQTAGGVAVAMIDAPRLEARVRSILDAARNRAALSWRVAGLLVVLSSAVAVTLAVLRADTSPPWRSRFVLFEARGGSAVAYAGDNVHFMLLYHGGFGGDASTGRDRKTGMLHDAGVVRMYERGPRFNFLRTQDAPTRLRINQRTYDLARGRIFLIRDDHSIQQLELPDVAMPASHADVERLVAQAEAKISPDIIVAEHVVLWNGEIVEWPSAVERLRVTLKDKESKTPATFRYTRGAFREMRWASLHVEDMIKEWSGAGREYRRSLAPERYDFVRAAADLQPHPDRLRRGIVRNPAGQPVAKATVVVFSRESDPLPIALTPNLTLLDPTAETWTQTDDQGRFQIEAPDAGYDLAVLAPAGFAIAQISKSGEPVMVVLARAGEFRFAAPDDGGQTMSFLSYPKGMSPTGPGFAIAGVTIGRQAEVIRLPPGKVVTNREFDLPQGMRAVVGFEQVQLQPGETRNQTLPALDAETLSKPFSVQFPPNMNPFASDKVVNSIGKPTQVIMTGLPLTDALRYLSEYHDFPIRPDAEPLKAANISLDNIAVALDLNSVSLHFVLRSMLEPAGLAYLVDEEGLLITTKEKAAQAEKKRPGPPAGPGGDQPNQKAPRRDDGQAAKEQPRSLDNSADKPDTGSDFLRDIRRASAPLLATMAREHGYGLASGQYLRRIAPPFAPIRMEYYRAAHPQTPPLHGGVAAMTFFWTDEGLQANGMTFGSPDDGYNLTSIVDFVLDLKSPFIEGPRDLLIRQRIPGDWVVRRGLADAKAIAARELESMLRKELSLPIRLELREVEREVYVASGEYRYSPLPGRGKAKLQMTDETREVDQVEIYGKEVVPGGGGAGGGSGEFSMFLDWLGRWIAVPIISEVKDPPRHWLGWMLNWREPQTPQSMAEDQDAALVLPNITAQTGVTFEKEKRAVRILFVERAQ